MTKDLNEYMQNLSNFQVQSLVSHYGLEINPPDDYKKHFGDMADTHYKSAVSSILQDLKIDPINQGYDIQSPLSSPEGMAEYQKIVFGDKEAPGGEMPPQQQEDLPASQGFPGKVPEKVDYNKYAGQKFHRTAAGYWVDASGQQVPDDVLDTLFTKDDTIMKGELIVNKNT